MSYPTVKGRPVEGTPYREAQVCLGPRFANSYYLFSLSGTNTATNIYSNGTLTTAFPVQGRVTSDAFGRFPAIWLDPSIIYRVQFYNSFGALQWQRDPYYSQLATVGTSSLSPYGFSVAPTGEVTMPAPNTGGSGVTLTLKGGALGTTPLQISSPLPGNSAIIINSSATTGAQTATFTATNKPGTATSSPAGWLPVTCDGVQYYTPIWHGNNFSPYVASPTAVGEVIVASSVTFGGSGLTTATGGTATPSNWFVPVATGIGAGYYINITKTSGLSALAFSAAQGAWTNITSGGLTISSNAQATIGGTYQISSSVTGSPVVAAGTITLSNNNGIQSPTYNGTTPINLAGNGTATLNSVGTSNWYAPTTANVGASYYILITPTGGTGGYSFSAATGTYANITNSGLTIGVNGTGATTFNVTGTYIIASDSGGVNQLGSGTITLNGSNVQSPNWSGTAPLNLAGNGSATLNSVGTSSWYSPNSSNVGSLFWIDITNLNTGTSGVNFSAAQGAWTNITNSGLSIGLSGYSGYVGTVTANGTYQISSSSGGTPVLGSGTVSLSLSGLTVLHVYTTGTAATETAPSGTSNVVIENWGGPGGGGGGYNGSGRDGGGGGGPGYSRTSIAASGGQTLIYTVGAKGSGGTVGNPGTAGTASTVSSGTLTITTMTANGGALGSPGLSGSGGAGGAGGTASGGTAANTTGGNGAAGGNAGSPGAGGTAPAGVNSSGNAGGYGGDIFNPGNAGTGPGVVAFYYS